MAAKSSSPYLKALFNIFNRSFWNSSLPLDTIVRWGSPREMTDWNGRKGKAPWGWFFYDEDDRPTILIDSLLQKKSWMALAAQTLLHETVHLGLKGRGNHGKAFKRELRRLMMEGAFDDLL